MSRPAVKGAMAVPHVLVRHKVRDFGKWKPLFDEHGATRRAAGSKGGYVLRSAEDPQEIVVLLEWDTVQKARQFTQSEDLKAAMERAGVADRPDIFLLDEVDRPRS
jgi:heme-degrading monooxygenase HmoA